jgi:hypothetical protein
MQKLCSFAKHTTSAVVLAMVTFMGMAVRSIDHRATRRPNMHAFNVDAELGMIKIIRILHSAGRRWKWCCHVWRVDVRVVAKQT